jgi:hypothetical protein
MPADLRATNLEPYVRLALQCVHRPLPHAFVPYCPANRPHHAFYGCFDWHSAVHSHWLLVRAIHLFPNAPWASTARSGLAQNLTEQNLLSEARDFASPGWASFERPYGLAWLLQLAAELREMETDPDARNWLDWLAALESMAVDRLSEWLPRLPFPIRTGEHSQTAFAMGLALDWARTSADRNFEQLLAARARDFHQSDRAASLAFEPSAYDFLSPCLSAADLMRRVMSAREYSEWLSGYLPEIPKDDSDDWLQPAGCPDPSDGKLSHLDGLNLSRAWMLEGIASAMDDDRRAALLCASAIHARAGLSAISDAHYAGAHWLGSFAVYLITRRGIGMKTGGLA